MKKGDLVNFYSTVAPFQEDYVNRNPGIILAFRDPMPGPGDHPFNKGSAYVLWANGEMTKEWESYLELAE